MVFSYVIWNMLINPPFPIADFLESMMYGLAIFGFLFPAIVTSYEILDIVTHLFSYGSSVLSVIACCFHNMLTDVLHMLATCWTAP